MFSKDIHCMSFIEIKCQRCQRVSRVSKGRYADQTPIPCVPVASPGFKPKGRVCTNSGALKPDKLKLA